MAKKVKIISVIILLSLFLVFSFAMLVFLGKEEAKRIGVNLRISCGSIEKEYIKEHNDFYQTINEARAQLYLVSSQRANKQKISESVYQGLTEKTVFLVSPKLLNPINGLTCYPFAYVRSDLPEQARRFVQRHELAHLLSSGAYDIQAEKHTFKNAELMANLEAAREYPLGFVETIFFSVANIWKSSPCSLSCKSAVLWSNFQKYFLP